MENLQIIKKGKNFTLDIQLENGHKPLSMIWIPPGEFVMGKNHIDFKDTKSEEMSECNHELYVREMPVKISKGFWLSQFQVTSEQSKSLSIKQGKWCKGEDFPFLSVSWLDAICFCRELNIRYKALLPFGYHFSLPTELQWEYAAKSGKEYDAQPLSYDEYKKIHSPFKVSQVGSGRVPNDWGLFDMLENAPEFCYDIAAYPFTPPWDEDRKKVYEIKDGKVVDWVSNKYPDASAFYFDDYYVYRVIKGWYSSTYRSGAAPKISLNSFRLCLRPIINIPYCDLDDPWLIIEGINILGE